MINTDKNAIKKKILFVYHSGHGIHESWCDSLGADKIPFVLNKNVSRKKYIELILKEDIRITNPFISQPLSILQSKNIPKADIYICEGLIAILPVLFRKQKNSKIILINSDTLFYDFPNFSKFKKIIVEYLLSKVDGIISTSKYMDELAKKYVEKPAVVVYPFIIHDELFKIKPNLDGQNICNLGGVRFLKGSDILISIFSKYKINHKNSNLFFIGNGSDKDLCFRGVNGNIVSNDIIITGFTNDLSKYFSNCGLYIAPARHEPFGVNILEAMAAGIPPIVTKYCGASELISKVSDKLIVSLDESDLLDSIDWLQQNKARKRRLSKKCRLVARQFTKDKSIASFRKSFNNLIDRI